MTESLEELGITTKSTKDQLWGALNTLLKSKQSAERQLDRLQRKQAQEQADAVAAITERIRSTKPKTQPEKLHNIITSATAGELKEFAEWADDLKDLHHHLPLAMQRLIVGVDVLLGRDEQDAAAA